MFSRKVRVEYEDAGKRTACPLKWLDSFSMRNFTNASVFDDTLPVADGQMEIGTNVPLDQLGGPDHVIATKIVTRACVRNGSSRSSGTGRVSIVSDCS